MTAQQLKDYIAAQLVAPVNQVMKVINSFFAVIDFTTNQVASIIPDWTSLLTFNSDGSGDGKYCKHPDTNGKPRIFESKTNGNINHQPPTNPAITEDTYWREVSSSASAQIPEYAPGLFSAGLQIVFHNHSVDGRGFYVLLEPVRPFASTNIETEITAGKWERIGGSGSGKGVAKTYTDISTMLADQTAQKQDFFYLVTDASADATVDAGWALYQKLAASTAAIGDYRKLNEAESLDLIIASTPVWDATTAGKVERSTTAESQNIVTRASAGSSNASNSDDRTPSEKGLVEMLISLLSTAWTWSGKQTFTSAPRFSSTTASNVLVVDSNKDLATVSYSTLYDNIDAADVLNAVSISSGTLTLNWGTATKKDFDLTPTASSDFTVAFSGSNRRRGRLLLRITGTVIITFPSACVMDLFESSVGRWNPTDNKLTLTGTTDSPFYITFESDAVGNMWVHATNRGV